MNSNFGSVSEYEAEMWEQFEEFEKAHIGTRKFEAFVGTGREIIVERPGAFGIVHGNQMKCTVEQITDGVAVLKVERHGKTRFINAPLEPKRYEPRYRIAGVCF